MGHTNGQKREGRRTQIFVMHKCSEIIPFFSIQKSPQSKFCPAAPSTMLFRKCSRIAYPLSVFFCISFLFFTLFLIVQVNSYRIKARKRNHPSSSSTGIFSMKVTVGPLHLLKISFFLIFELHKLLGFITTDHLNQLIIHVKWVTNNLRNPKK